LLCHLVEGILARLQTLGLEEEKKERKIVNNNEVHHIFISNKTQGNTLKTIKQHSRGGKG
jgi:hypothetical protein